MQTYLDAHAAFVHWLDGAADCDPTAEQVEQAMFALAAQAAQRGMTGAHWMFVVDGLIAHAKRRCPDNPELSSFVARGFDFSTKWPPAISI
ncbi:hypothetical protein DFR29_104110 [Tahibacter aquaticus]|uniref:Uncharacterized protein n=1 Tax=Tahibacter aquaticus TaxID=520092 RepID=A0A4R6Z285_9GAMM|nr:hypothetical protein [Tahibacter aquaticus]TDR45682.1 hypothetical protein DFR29_104110 [Tahibacter aquaticus]